MQRLKVVQREEEPTVKLKRKNCTRLFVIESAAVLIDTFLQLVAAYQHNWDVIFKQSIVCKQNGRSMDSMRQQYNKLARKTTDGQSTTPTKKQKKEVKDMKEAAQQQCIKELLDAEISEEDGKEFVCELKNLPDSKSFQLTTKLLSKLRRAMRNWRNVCWTT